MRFGGRFFQAISEATDTIEEQADTLQVRRMANEAKSAYGASTIDIVTGPHPPVNLLDMIVFVTLSRIVLEDYWRAEVFGERADPLIHTFRRFEAEIWSIASKVMTPAQQQDLRALIQQWRNDNPNLIYVESVRFGDFSEKLGEAALANVRSGGGLLPEVTEATRAVDEVRLLFERVLFYLQRVPHLARMETKGAYYDLVGQPEAKQLMADAATIGKGLNRVADGLDELPALVSRERVATFNQASHLIATERENLLQGLESEEARVSSLLGDLQQTLTTGSELVSRVNSTVETVNIDDYRETVEEVSGAAQQLSVLTESINRLLLSPGWEQRLPQLTGTMNQLGQQGEAVIDYIFRQGVLLIVIWFVVYIVARLVYQSLSKRLFRLGP